MSRARLSTAALTAVVLVFAGCALRSPTIAEIKNDPGRYHDRSVSVTGRVVSAWGVPLVPYSVYTIDDGTGELTVLSQARRTPTRGARVRVKGRLHEVAVVGGRSIGLHLQARDIDFKR
jgi:hypothetical protein